MKRVVPRLRWSALRTPYISPSISSSPAIKARANPSSFGDHRILRSALGERTIAVPGDPFDACPPSDPFDACPPRDPFDPSLPFDPCPPFDPLDPFDACPPF